jgi:hypothetical protein
MNVLAEPPSANGFEFTLYGCGRCQSKAMYCVCTATATGAPEAISDEDAATILGGGDLRDFMDDWQRRVIGA